ncbi:Hsp20/alpha crystallin family protein [Aquisalimonas sp. 2447]|uniref:Hsp20/alpha crystallin family protein n=1 Tax=Aquisalimonas sp. 2447 TaxID=2740807 RepID=UPI0014325D1C|nr:Hsp20/alpha crystallin family protein [Aquisalimonas sp. 2447]QIT56842.1 Hsp20/alpha crystallin family protein [Aquisalimonas sp. 2447]
MNIRRYEPWSVLNQLSNEMNSLFANSGQQLGDPSTMATSDWVPAVDIQEEQDRYLIKADVPGVKPDDIDVQMENGILTIKGERSAEDVREDNGYRRVERIRGAFHRRFTLPDTADAENITATSRDGVLEVVIPKQDKVQPRRITVKG